jgi:hypothetical protein
MMPARTDLELSGLGSCGRDVRGEEEGSDGDDGETHCVLFVVFLGQGNEWE